MLLGEGELEFVEKMHLTVEGRESGICGTLGGHNLEHPDLGNKE